MIKIKNKILIYFIFYINNISFLINEEVHNQVATNEKEKQNLTEKQIQDHNIEDNNNEERNFEPKNENITSENDENEIKNYKSFFNKINKKNILIKIIIGFSGMSLLLILFFIHKIYKRKNKEITKEEIQKPEKIQKPKEIKKLKKEEEEEIEKQEKLNLIKDFIKEEINNLNILICIKNEKKNNNCWYIGITKKDIFLNYLDELFVKIPFFSYLGVSCNFFNCKYIKDKLSEFKNKIENNNQQKILIINFKSIYNNEIILNINLLECININNSCFEINLVKDEKEKEILKKILNNCCEQKTNP